MSAIEPIDPAVKPIDPAVKPIDPTVESAALDESPTKDEEIAQKQTEKQEIKYGSQPDGSYLTPYSHVVFYNPDSFFESALAMLTESTCVIPYYMDIEINWADLADLPQYVCPTVVLFDSYSYKIPVELLKFIERGFKKVCILSRRQLEYDIECVCAGVENAQSTCIGCTHKVYSYEEYFRVFKYQSYGHEEIINMLLEYGIGAAKESTHLFLRGMLFAAYNADKAVERLAGLIKSGARILDNIQRAEQRGVAINDVSHHIGRTIMAGAQLYGDWLVALITPLLIGEHGAPDFSGSFKKYVHEHAITTGRGKWCALIYPMASKWYVSTFAIGGEEPPKIPQYATREELLAAINIPWLVADNAPEN